MSVGSDAVEKKSGGLKRYNAGVFIIFSLVVAVGLAIYWQYPNFYRHPVAQFFSWAARVSALLGNGKIAYFTANRAAALDPTNLEYTNKRCFYGSLAGNVEEVIGDCKRLVEAQPSNPSAHCGLGLALVFSGDYKNAIKEFQFFVDHAGTGHHDDTFIQDHKQWIALMEKDTFPFNDLALGELLLH